MSTFRDRSFTYANGTITLRYKPVRELFKFNEPPYVAIGATKGGKTTLCLDIIAQFASEASNIYYFTQTEQNLGSQDGGLSLIPESYRRAPTYENISAVYNEIIGINEAINADTKKHIELLTEITKDRELVARIMKIIEADADEVANERLKYYTNKKYSVEKANQYAANDRDGFIYETLSRVITDFAEQRGSVIDSLSQEMITRLQTLHSRRPKTILIMDDVTSALGALQRDKTKVMFGGQSTTKYNAFASMLLDMLTRGRHWNAIICIFLHSLNVLEAAKGNINNLIVVEPSVIQQLNNIRSINKSSIQALGEAGKIVFTDEYKYHVMHVNVSDGASNITVNVTKADLHGALEKLKLEPLNQKFLELYNNINNGLITNDNIYANNDEDSGEDEGGVADDSSEIADSEDNSSVAGDDMIQSII